jgi:hypothetical protein
VSRDKRGPFRTIGCRLPITLSVHTGVNKVATQFVTILLLYQKLLSTYEAMDVEVVCFLLTQEGMKYKMPQCRLQRIVSRQLPDLPRAGLAPQREPRHPTDGSHGSGQRESGKPARNDTIGHRHKDR